MKSRQLTLGFLIALAMSMLACNNNMESQDEEKVVENENAIKKYLADSSLTNKVSHDSAGFYYYKRVLNPTGEVAKTGNSATVKFNAYLLNGAKVLSVVNDSTYDLPIGGNVTRFGGIELGIYQMRTGEKASFFLPYYLAFGNLESTNVPAYSPVRLEMEFIKTRTEAQQINDYIASKQYAVSERTADNLVIIRSNTVTGDTLGSGKSVNVKYVGKLLDGTKFDEGTIPVTTNTGGLISGFDRAVRKMRKTEKVIAIFPSGLGYRQTGSGKIPPYAPLIFELEVL